MTTTPHKLATIANNHGIVGLGPYGSATARRAAVLTAADVGKVAQQTDTDPATYWIVLKVVGGVGTWSRVDTGAEATGTPLTIITSVPVYNWLRADLGVTIGTGVSAWADQSANAQSYTQGTGANQPTRNASDATLGNQATITGDGVNDQLNNAAAVVPASFWLCLVVKQISWTINCRICESLSGTSKANIYQGSGTPGLQFREDALQTTANNGATIGAWKRVTAQESNATTDGILIGSTFVGGSALGRTATSNQYTLFGAWAGSLTANVAIAEMILTNGIPNSTEKTNIDAYLLARYGLASLFT